MFSSRVPWIGKHGYVNHIENGTQMEKFESIENHFDLLFAMPSLASFSSFYFDVFSASNLEMNGNENFELKTRNCERRAQKKFIMLATISDNDNIGSGKKIRWEIYSQNAQLFNGIFCVWKKKLGQCAASGEKMVPFISVDRKCAALRFFILTEKKM